MEKYTIRFTDPNGKLSKEGYVKSYNEKEKSKIVEFTLLSQDRIVFDDEVACRKILKKIRDLYNKTSMKFVPVKFVVKQG